MKITNPKIKKLLEKFEVISSLEQLSSLAEWDLEVKMPEGAGANRAKALAKTQSLIQKLYLDEEFVALAEEASRDDSLNDYEKAIIRILRRTLYRYYKLPKEFIENFVKTTNESQLAWREARAKNDFSIFEPHLKKIVELNIEEAKLLEYEDHPYDAMLDKFEEDLKTKDVVNYFESIKPHLTEILAYIKKSKKYSSRPHLLEKGEYEQGEVEKLNYKVLDYLQYNKEFLRLDVSTHPFSEGINSKDVRITTRYFGKDFGSTITATMHEFGHALYDMQVDSSLDFTPIGRPTSLILHESQSRFWENIIGRSDEFIKIFTPKYKKLGEAFRTYAKSDYYSYFNSVKPSLIRVEADEITYHFHILIRFEIEKMLIEKSISVADLPAIWNEKYKKYLGIKPKTNKEGVLQDIHWSMGCIGYFPTYSMGTVLSSYWAERIELELNTIPNLIKSEEGIRKIQSWLKENIHQHGAGYTMKELLNSKFRTEYTITPWVKYINKKYRALY